MSSRKCIYSEHAEMVVRFAQAIEVSSDGLWGIVNKKNVESATSLRLPRRTKKIEEFPPSQQKMFLKTISPLIPRYVSASR